MGRRGAVRSLEHLPVRLARSAHLVVLASAPLFEQLRPALDILVWRLMGGGQDTIQLLPIVEGKRASDALLAAVDAFHVMYCDEPRLAERRRVARSVDTASMGAINEAVRALYPACLLYTSPSPRD